MFFKNFFTREVTDLLSNAATIGLHLVSATFVGLAMGYYLDKWLDTKPWFTLLMLIFGVAAGFKNVYQEARRIQRQQGSPPAASGPGADQGRDSPGSTPRKTPDPTSDPTSDRKQ